MYSISTSTSYICKHIGYNNLESTVNIKSRDCIYKECIYKKIGIFVFEKM